jgi:cellulose synthase/poly-beta-1,6-N-acetylglucosamine synthase-like glycosyltransferase
MSAFLFWLATGLIGYTYAGFPVLVMLRAKLRPRPHRTADVTPSVSVVIAAHDEERSIGDRVDNLLEVDYPADRLEVIIASDGSTDRTVAEARRREDARVRVLDLPRTGKANALNAAVGASTGEILVFSDANTAYAPDALRQLVRSFADPEVGGVAGNQVYLSSAERGSSDPSSATAIGAGERSYWDFDRVLKDAESLGGSVISATGAIYAIRRELFRAVPDGVTDDFMTSTRVIAAGRRLVFEPAAVALEPVASSGRGEYRRKVRIMTRGLRGVAMARELLDPRRYGFYAVQLFTHKVLRRLMAVPLLVIAATSATLWNDGPIYRLAVLGQVGVYGLGTIGLALRGHRAGRRPWFSLPAFFLLVNIASLHAAWNLITGRRIDRWQPARSTEATATPATATPATATPAAAEPPRAQEVGR